MRGERSSAGDAACVEFLRWALPKLDLRWESFRKVRRQVCKRAARRAVALGLADLPAYREHLERHPEEWEVLDGLTCITISRFYRDRGVFGFVEREVLPRLAGAARADGRAFVDAWSAGCASGEEPYTLAVVWNLIVGPRFPNLELRVLATDIEPAVLRRARRACYSDSSLKDLPPELSREAFTVRDGEHCLRPEHRCRIEFRHHDIRSEPTAGPFDLVLCRNLAFTYFEPNLQLHVCGLLAGALRSGGALVLGSHERLPSPAPGFEPWPGSRGIYRRL